MWSVIARQALWRLAAGVPIVVVVTLITFVMLFSLGDPAAVIAGENATPERVQEVRDRYGFDRPVLIQYLLWLGNALTGDLGMSMHERGSVVYLISSHATPTMMLAALALIIAVGASILMGSVIGTRPGGLVDGVLRIFALLGIAVPNFLVGLLFILLFAIMMPLFPAGGFRRPGDVGWVASLRYVILPAAALSMALMAQQMRTFRASLLKEYREPYVGTARMKGVSESGIFFRHVARNASAPLVTVIGLEVGLVVTGALLVEVVFGIPGLGSLILQATQMQDFTVVQALVALTAIVIVVANLVADLVAVALNPMVRGKA